MKLKLTEKQSKIIKHFPLSKKVIFFCVCINGHIFSIYCKSMEKKGVKALEHGGETWINQGHPSNICVKIQYFPDEF